MSEVALRIGGQTYMVACGTGEEARLVKLGEMIEGKLKSLEGNLSAQDAQNLLFAALLLADDLDEARGGADSNNAKNAREGRGTGEDQRNELSDSTAERLERLASSLENCAGKLESCLTAP